tara:strand:+ start:594 stop:827 length:234 start_codon:yes stop_codon:yes gene_type:complete
MPDASTQTTKGKNIKLIPKKQMMSDLKEYNGVMLPKFVNGREVVAYPNAGRDFKRVAEEMIQEQVGSLSGIKVSCNF